MREKILVVDDQVSIRWALQAALQDWEYQPIEAASGAEAIAICAAEHPHVVLLDLGLPDGPGLDVLAEIKRRHPQIIVIIITGYANTGNVSAAERSGAFATLGKPIDRAELETALREGLAAQRALKQAAALPPAQMPAQQTTPGSASSNPNQIIGASPQTAAMRAFIRQVAAVEAAVLLEGESGTGKELLARAIHSASPRAANPFVAINCGAFNSGLIESELFGHEKGAFTGAVARKTGRFERAEGGTLLLDEIGEMPLPEQVKLLRALQERRIERVGGTGEIVVDVRIVAATNRDLWAEVEAGRFRRDLYFRLAILTFTIPPLRERAEDVLPLTQYFLALRNLPEGARIPTLTPEAEAALLRHNWPGNVRELKNVIERAFAMGASDRITAEDLVFHTNHQPPAAIAVQSHSLKGESAPLPAGVKLSDLSLSERRKLIKQALQQSYGNRAKAAELLGLASRHQLYRLMKKIGISDGP